MARRNLVIVRAGRGSRHPTWLDHAAERSFDLAVVAFEDAAPDGAPSDAIRELRPGGKWDGVHGFLAANPRLLESYDYFWIPDDDIEASQAGIETIFRLMQQHRLSVGQPALSHQSYFTHFLMLSCPGFRVRFTNWVEVMVPCLSAAALRAIHNDFAGTMSGFGLDYVWCRLGRDNHLKAGVLDAVTVDHLRPVGTALQPVMRQAGADPDMEHAKLAARYGIGQRPTPLAYAGVDAADGMRIDGLRRLGLTMGYRYGLSLPSFRHPGEAAWKLVQLVRRQLMRDLDLTALNRLEI